MRCMQVASHPAAQARRDLFRMPVLDRGCHIIRTRIWTEGLCSHAYRTYVRLLLDQTASVNPGAWDIVVY